MVLGVVVISKWHMQSGWPALILRRFAAKLKPGFVFTKSENPAEVPQDLATVYGGNWAKCGARSLERSGPFGGLCGGQFLVLIWVPEWPAESRTIFGTIRWEASSVPGW